MYKNTKEIISLLKCGEKDMKTLFNQALEVKLKNVGNKVYLRGLIEYSNVCQKNCYYCGLRKDNNIDRYTLTEEEVIESAIFAYKNNFASIVIQSGEIQSNSFTKKITKLLNKINENTDEKLGITLSLGEQNKDVLKEWKEAGAIRYLLRIETSNPILYSKIHPNNKLHSYNERLKTLKVLKDLDYQVGTGIMVGLPFQTTEDLANDILFFKENAFDMFGIGPYIEHSSTPLYDYKTLLSLQERFDLTLKMLAILRIMMPNVNIASTTALQTIDPQGREKAIQAGANIIMPNISPTQYRKKYLLYENKVCIEEAATQCMNCISNRINSAGAEVGLGEQGNSIHYLLKIAKK